MSSNPLVPSFRYPVESLLEGQPEGVVRAHRITLNAVTDLQSAIPELKSQIDALKSSSSSTSTTTETVVTNNESAFPGLGSANDQTGNTSYITQTGDNGALLMLNDASAVAVSLNSTVATPYFLFVSNAGAGAVTLTPSSGKINGATSLTLAQFYFAVVVFDGTNWTASAALLPQSASAVASQWLNSYDSATGEFTQSQPAIADVSGLSAALALLAPLASPSLTGTPTAPTASPGTDDTQIATTAYTDAAVGVETARAEAAEALLAPLASPTFTGTVTQPTPSVLTGATTDTSATAGSATALPATPTGYLEVSINATVVKIPYYSV